MNQNIHYFKFEDTEFPSNKESLFINGNKIKLLNLIHSKGLKKVNSWLRPEDVVIYKRDKDFNLSLFDNPLPTISNLTSILF